VLLNRSDDKYVKKINETEEPDSLKVLYELPDNFTRLKNTDEDHFVGEAGGN